jgi:hypothetical protein
VIARLRELLPLKRPLLEIDTIGYLPGAGRCDINRGDERVAEFVKKEDAAAIVAAMNSLPALLECAEALEKIAKLPRYTDGDNEAQDIARAALQALVEGGGE